MYNDYTIEEFVMDEAFREWVLSPNETNQRFWRAWMADHPQKVTLLQEARNIILFAEYTEIDIDEEKSIASWENIKNKILEADGVRVKVSAQNTFFGINAPTVYRIAAAFVGVIMLVATYFYMGSTTLDYATRFGEVKTIWLPDSSQVILNANSRLIVHRRLFSANTREVSLTGEAFFTVRKNPQGARKVFVVHANDIDVEVLGTTFNVNNRSGRTWVVLNTGKVQLNGKESSTTPLIMNPGELGEYSEASGKFIARKVDTEIYTGWRVNQLIFDGKALGQVITFLEQNYGFDIVVRDSMLLNKKFAGKFPADRPDLLLSALSASFNLEITRTANTIIMDRKDGGQ